MSYANLRDFTPEYVERIGDFDIALEKLGGGTLGHAYEGIWRYIVIEVNTDLEVMRGQDLSTGTPHTHTEAARILYGFITGDADDYDD